MADEVIFKDRNDKEISVATVPITDIKESITKNSNEISTQILPNIGTIFSINGVMYKVVYVNNGKDRFSASPVR